MTRKPAVKIPPWVDPVLIGLCLFSAVSFVRAGLPWFGLLPAAVVVAATWLNLRLQHPKRRWPTTL